MVDVTKLINTSRPGSAHLAGECRPELKPTVDQVCQMTGWDDETAQQRKVRDEHRVRNVQEAKHKGE